MLFSGATCSVDKQLENNRHTRWGLVLAVLAVLLLYAYLFTHIADSFAIPRPAELAKQIGIDIKYVFDRDSNVGTDLHVIYTPPNKRDDQRLILFAIVAGAFLCAYFLPLAYKRPSLVLWFLVAILIIYGIRASAGLLFAHLLIYLSFHPPPLKRSIWQGLLPGALACLAFMEKQASWLWLLLLLLIFSAISLLLVRYLLLPLLQHERAAKIIRTLFVQSALIVVFISAIVEGLQGQTWTLPLGILLFFWHWERLIMYHVDFKDGLVPNDTSLPTYLSIFFSPGGLPNGNWGPSIGLGYNYTQSRFLSVDKNKLIVSGLKLWGIALLYLVFADWFRFLIVGVFNDTGIPVFSGHLKTMSCAYVGSSDISSISVLMTTLLDLMRWLMMWGAIVHFKVGVWRMCGYDIDPFFNKPWLATNLVSFWPRFTFHYREFLVRAFYYPVFFRFFKKHTKTRVVFATVVAVGFGNMIWGHLTEGMFYDGMRFQNFGNVLETWPYFLFLTAGIALTELYLLQKKSRRKPWTRDRYFAMDVLCSYLTLQFFALIHIFAWPCQTATQGDNWLLFLKAFGI